MELSVSQIAVAAQDESNVSHTWAGNYARTYGVLPVFLALSTNRTFFLPSLLSSLCGTGGYCADAAFKIGMHEKQNVKKGIGIFGLVNILVYGLEFLRSLVIAAYFGVNARMDAFYAGKSLPDFVQSLFGAAAYSAILPIYPTPSEDTSARQKVLFSGILGVGALFLGLALASVSFSAQIIAIAFPGLETNEATLAAQTFSVFWVIAAFRILFNILRSYYDQAYQFLLPALLLLLPPLCATIAIFFFEDRFGVLSTALGMLLAATLAFGILFFHFLKKTQHQLHLRVDKDIISSILQMLFPIAMGSVAYRLNTVVDRVFASSLAAGSITALQYGYNILNIPHAFLNMPVSQALFPTFARAAQEENYEQMRRYGSQVLRLLFVLNVLPLWMMVFFRQEIVTVIYGRGAFDERAIEMTANTLFYYALGFVVFSANSLLIRILMSLQDRPSLYLLGSISIVTNIIANWALAQWLDYGGIALATSVVQFIWFTVAYTIVSRRIGVFFTLKDLQATGMLLGLSCLTVYCSYWLASWISQPIDHWRTYLMLTVGGILSVLSYICLVYLLRLPEFHSLIDIFQQVRQRIFRFRPFTRIA